MNQATATPWLATAGWLLAIAALICIMGTPYDALAQGGLEAAVDKLDVVIKLIIRIFRGLFLISGFVLAYIWVKGSPEARQRTERYLIGLIIAFSLNELINFFLPEGSP